MKPAPKKPSLQKTPARKKPARKSAMTWDILTALLLGLTGLSCLCFGLIFVNPNLPLNPFPPGTPVAPLAVSLPTATAIGPRGRASGNRSGGQRDDPDHAGRNQCDAHEHQHPAPPDPADFDPDAD